MESINYYKVYGMNIISEFNIPELEHCCEIEDIKKSVRIYLHTAPDEIKEAISKGIQREISENIFWYNIKNAGIFIIRNGNEMIIEPEEELNEEIINFIIGNALGYILLQRGEIPIHGSSIILKNGVAVITGNCGAGKSTVTLSLEERGYKFLADDIAAINMCDSPYVEFGFPYHKLCSDMVEKLGIEKENCRTAIGAYERKYIVEDKENFSKEKAPIKFIFEISIGNNENVSVEELNNGAKLQGIIKSIYKANILTSMGGLKPSYFKSILKLSQNIRFFKIIRPWNKDTLQEILNIIEGISYKEDLLKYKEN